MARWRAAIKISGYALVGTWENLAREAYLKADPTTSEEIAVLSTQ